MLQPPYLQAGDTIAITSTARWAEETVIEQAIATLERWGFRVILGKYVHAKHHQFAGTDEQRLQEFQQMLDNPDIKAILFSRGGYGTTRIIDEVDWRNFLQQPKWLCGFSDVTAILCHLYRLGVQGIHCTMAGGFDNQAGRVQSVESLRRLLLGESLAIEAPRHALNRPGRATGQLLGGNLSLLNNLIATASEPSYEGAVLFIEDLDEYLYHVDRMMVHLKRSGRLQDLAGIIVGQMSDMHDNTEPFGKGAYEIIQEHVAAYSYPVAFGFAIGHEPLNMAVPVGARVMLEVSEAGSKLYQPTPIS
ncbi:putative MccF-like protein (microcin C7 resistance) [Flammeovirgaceae bacterium 311]|nr:putative MccF-like protein (microcin C7 resistance) [Flammeovirgaceae bacterium 311]